MNAQNPVQVLVAELANAAGSRVYVGWAPGLRSEDQSVNGELLEPEPTLERLLERVGREPIVVYAPGLDPYRPPFFYPRQHLRTMLGRYEVTDPERIATRVAELGLRWGLVPDGSLERTPGRNHRFRG